MNKLSSIHWQSSSIQHGAAVTQKKQYGTHHILYLWEGERGEESMQASHAQCFIFHLYNLLSR